MELKKLKVEDDAAPTLEKIVEMINALHVKLEATHHLLNVDVVKKLPAMLFAVMGKDEKKESSLVPDGIAFFVSDVRAVTPRHVIIDDSVEVKKKLPLRKIEGETVFLASQDDLNDGKTSGLIEMRVIESDYKEDWAILQLVNKNDHEIVPFVVCSDANEFSNNRCVLLTMNIAFGGSAADEPYKITLRETSINVLSRTISYDVQTSKGDSGGAIVVGLSGQVVGMHVEFKNTLSDEKKFNTVSALREEVESGHTNGMAGGLRLDYLRNCAKF